MSKSPSYIYSRPSGSHPTTDAAQLVEIRETVQEIVVPTYVEAPPPASPKPLLFTSTPTEELLSYGVPPEWIDDVRKADEDTLLGLVDHLPGEAAEALLELAVGGSPSAVQPEQPVGPGMGLPTSQAEGLVEPAAVAAAAFDHPDA